MTSNTVPIYRHGRKFYVSAEEYERIRSEERRQRRTTAQKAQQTPIRSPSSSLYIPIQRNHSNPYDYKYGVLKTPHLPINSLINRNIRREPTRLSHIALKHYNDYDDLSSLTPAISKKKTQPTTTRSNSSDRLIDNQRTPLSSDSENEIKRSLSAEITQLSSLPEQPKPKQSSHISLRRPVPTTISDYGISPITSFSMTSNDQSHIQTNPSKLTNSFTRMKQSNLNPPSKSSSSAISGTGSLFESGIQGSDHSYSIGSTNRRTGGGTTSSSSLLTRSTSDNSKNEYYHQDTASGGSFSDDTSSSLLGLIQRRNTDTNRSRRTEYIGENDDDYNQQRDLWTRSTIRSQSSDGLTEKKRVRFADMEGLTLETIPDRNQLKSPINNRLLTRQQHAKISSNPREQSRPFYNLMHQTTTKVGGSKLATDV